MDLKELKEKLTEILLQEIEEITAEQLLNGEDEKGANFEIKVGDRNISINLKTVFNEEKCEYIQEEYTILN